jgi:hypothetical protein
MEGISGCMYGSVCYAAEGCGVERLDFLLCLNDPTNYLDSVVAGMRVHTGLQDYHTTPVRAICKIARCALTDMACAGACVTHQVPLLDVNMRKLAQNTPAAAQRGLKLVLQTHMPMSPCKLACRSASAIAVRAIFELALCAFMCWCVSV